jgi:type II restriction/modification system DNA methylase subunit YeeA
MDYYIRPEEPHSSEKEGDFLRISSPEEIKICDPACGSGHMLTYAFDLLYAIYEEQGYQATDIPRLILTHNLYGIEIDQRAGALAAFALTMKAREKDRRFFTRRRSNESRVTSNESSELNTQNSLLTTQPNICVLENIEQVELEDLAAYREIVGETFTDDLVAVVNQWEEADNFGSLIRPLVTDVSEVLAQLSSPATTASLLNTQNSLLITQTHQKVLTALRQADYLSPKYHVVVANPPYMGGTGMNARLKREMQSKYEEVKSDLFSAFIVRNLELSVCGGQLGFMSPFTWMFISSYEKLRLKLVTDATITSLIQLEYSGFEGATVPICTFTLENSSKPDFRGGYIKLSEFKGAENQAPKTLEAIENQSCNWFFRAQAKHFPMIPGSPIAFWVDNTIRKLFAESSLLKEYAEPRKGMVTADNPRFVRSWFEVSCDRIGFSMEDREAAKRSNRKWFPMLKGGEFRRWSGNMEHVVNWENDGHELLHMKDEGYKTGSTNHNLDYIFKPAITWTKITSSDSGFRINHHGYIFHDASGLCPTRDPDHINWVCALLNSPISTFLLRALNPTLNLNPGNLADIPVILPDTFSDAPRACEDLSKTDWDRAELSWDFTSIPILLFSSQSLEEAALSIRERGILETQQLQELEEGINARLIDLYGLEGDITPNVPRSKVTLNSNPNYRYGSDKSESELEALLLADTMREFISYAVGCMLGRYSLDKPGLILANQGETADDYLRIVGEYLVMSNERKKDGREQLSGSDRVAEGHGRGGDDLSGDEAVSEGGNLRAEGSDSQSGSVHSVKHSGGSGTEINGGLQEVPADRSGIESGSGNSASDRTSSQLHNSGTTDTDSGSVGGDLEDVKLTESEAQVTSNELPVMSKETQYSLLNTDNSKVSITFEPDVDNVIPLLDGDWFTDDISERFKEFLKVTFGTEHYEENLTFLENSLYPDNLTGKKRKTIRDYFLKEFYNHHIKLYKKRPIYWLFSSPKGTFNALIYMHRYRPDTVSTVLGYLRDFNVKLNAQIETLQQLADSADAGKSEKTKALKSIDKLKKQIRELDDYERDVLYPLATERIEIDLDDGVKQNYPRFGKALKKVTGLSVK